MRKGRGSWEGNGIVGGGGVRKGRVETRDAGRRYIAKGRDVTHLNGLKTRSSLNMRRMEKRKRMEVSWWRAISM